MTQATDKPYSLITYSHKHLVSHERVPDNPETLRQSDTQLKEPRNNSKRTETINQGSQPQNTHYPAYLQDSG